MSSTIFPPPTTFFGGNGHHSPPHPTTFPNQQLLSQKNHHTVKKITKFEFVDFITRGLLGGGGLPRVMYVYHGAIAYRPSSSSKSINNKVNVYVFQAYVAKFCVFHYCESHLSSSFFGCICARKKK
ncbi:hypothetical protein Hanom_Chr09g00838881 [Helianthus anomalus]